MKFVKKRIRRVRNKIKEALFSASRNIYTKELLGDRYKIGEHTYGEPKVFSWGEGTTLTIGKYCSISTNVRIFLGSEHRTDWVSTYPFPYFLEEAKSISGHPSTKGDVVIGNDVWIGYGVTILSGVTIGDGAAIGACSLVIKDVPPYAVVAGNPAQIIRYRFDEKTIHQLLKIRWWDWPDQRVRENIQSICSPSIDDFIK
ncbi:MAG: CatB-related O-acetyltransferase, partial [Deltaproteobacteria bacterium]|nr:CatB-related O-acetyltransferase [Deltaproteobacteria bacterium]